MGSGGVRMHNTQPHFPRPRLHKKRSHANKLTYPCTLFERFIPLQITLHTHDFACMFLISKHQQQPGLPFLSQTGDGSSQGQGSDNADTLPATHTADSLGHQGWRPRQPHDATSRIFTEQHPSQMLWVPPEHEPEHATLLPTCHLLAPGPAIAESYHG